MLFVIPNEHVGKVLCNGVRRDLVRAICHMDRHSALQNVQDFSSAPTLTPAPRAHRNDNRE